jgi:rhodanese-related sulfurtransferase
LIRTPDARQFFEGQPKALFVDVRAPKEYASGRIPGAINVPADKIEARWSELPRDRNIVLYESGTSAGDVCAFGRAAGRVLLAHGFSRDQVKVYQDGLAGWEKVNLPVEH